MTANQLTIVYCSVDLTGGKSSMNKTTKKAGQNTHSETDPVLLVTQIFASLGPQVDNPVSMTKATFKYLDFLASFRRKPYLS